MYVFSNKQICGQKASFLPSTSVTTNIPELYGFTKMNQFHLHCRVHEPLMFCEKCAIVDSLGYFLPSCLTCLLFLKWLLFTNQTSSKSEQTAFVFYNNLKLDFRYALYITFHVWVCLALVRSMKYLMESPAYLATAT